MRRLTILLVLVLLAVAGCGGDEETPGSAGESGESEETTPSGGGGGQNLALAADAGALKFDKSELTAKPGKVTITMENPSDTPHNVVIDDAPGAKAGETVEKGGQSVATADLKAGEYTYYCAVGNHRGAGMEGTLTVN
jgi:plastocyanin